MDPAALIAQIEASGAVRERSAPAVHLTLSDEQVAAWQALLSHFGTDKTFPIPTELVPAELAAAKPDDLASDLAKHLRGIFCQAEGGNGSFVWISGYAKKDGTAYIGAVDRISGKSNAYKRLLEAGTIGKDGRYLTVTPAPTQ